MTAMRMLPGIAPSWCWPIISRGMASPCCAWISAVWATPAAMKRAATTEDFAGDALAGVAYLKTRTEVNPRQIGLIGHSEGGMIAPIVAVRSNDVAFLVLLAGPGVPGEQLLLTQSESIKHAMGASQADIDDEHRIQQALFAIVKNEPDDAKAAQQIRRYLNDELDKLPAQELQGLGDREQFIKSQTDGCCSHPGCAISSSTIRVPRCAR